MVSILYTWLKMHISSERGQDLIEYAMLGGLIAIALAAGALVFSGALADMSTGIGDCIDFKSSTTCTPF